MMISQGRPGLAAGARVAEAEETADMSDSMRGIRAPIYALTCF